jgi:DNA-binding IclR family transcriptional regulator
MPRRAAGTVKAERVRLALLEARPGSLTIQQLCTATGLSASQVRGGLTEIKEHAAMEHLTH